jgi:quercetin dioxygenase-like cupin family protein
MNQTRPVTSDVGTRLLFENDRVRVWDLCLQPGESTGLHRHESDYLYVVIGDGTLQGKNTDGSDRPVQHMPDGEVRFREIEGEEVHEAVNVGDRQWRNIIVELKEDRS